MTDVDAELFERVRCRDGGAFRDVVARHHGRQVRLAALCTADSETAEALVRASWISSIVAIERSSVVSSLPVWLARGLLETIRTPAWLERSLRDASPAADPVPVPVPICAAIRRLPELERWVVMLRDVERWSAADVGECLGLSNDEVRGHLHHGRSALVASCASA